MPGCCSTPLKRKGLLGNLKNLVNAIDYDAPFSNSGPVSYEPCCYLTPCNYPCEPSPQWCETPYVPSVQSPCPPFMPECCPPPYPANYSQTDPEGPSSYNQSTIPCPPLSVPMCPPCPPCCRPCVPCTPPEAMICFKRPQTTNNYNVLTTSKSRELLSSVLYTGCLCERRNGLQDDCPRTECRGRPECLSKPYPICNPSMFANGKHLGRSNYGTTKCLEEYQCFPLCGPCSIQSCPQQSFGCC